MKIEERKTMKKINFVPANLSISENSRKCSGQGYPKRGFFDTDSNLERAKM